MNNQKRLIIKQLDRKINKLLPLGSAFVPPTGWLMAIRTALGIPRKIIAKKLNISEPTLFGVEKREVEGSVTLKTLREIASAMDLELVYGFVPKDGSLEKYINKKARLAATKIVLRTAHTMDLEAQTISDKRIKAAINEKTRELTEKMPGFIWE